MSEEKGKIQPNNTQAITLDPSYLDNAKDWEDFINLWIISKEIDQRNQWFKGDIANKVAVIHGEGSLKRFAQEVEESIRTIENYRRVARAFPFEKRNWKLSWTHYFIASYTDSYKKGQNQFDGENRFDWIEKAHDNNWTTTRLIEEVKKKQVFIGKEDASVFDYYEEYLKKVRNVLMHVEKDRLIEKEKNDLIHKLLDIYNEFMVYLKE
jgi:hypothetical protein